MNGIQSRSRAAGWIAAGVLLAMAGAAGSAAVVGGKHGTFVLFGTAMAAAGVGASAQVARRWMNARAEAEPRRRTRVLVVGCGPVAQHVAREAEAQGYDVLGFVEDAAALPQGERVAGVIGTRADLANLAYELRADQVIVTDTPNRAWAVLEEIERGGVSAGVYVVPDLYELAISRPTSLRIGDVALVELPRTNAGWALSSAKRALDVAASVFLLVVLAPFLALSALLIAATSPGGVLFRQVRIGKNGKPFEIVKFRTMVVDAEKDGPKLCAGKNDPRLTPVGKFLRKTHLDEVPQLLNVLQGEMSLVGPRPERPVFVEQFSKELPRYQERHRVLPGITGLAQMNGYYHSSPREKLRYDLMYVYHPSPWMDLCILFRTAMSVFK